MVVEEEEEEAAEEEAVTSKASICQTCGDIGFKELLLCCSKCHISLEHRYCLAKIPKVDDDEFTYICAQCVSRSADKNSSEQFSRKRRKLVQHLGNKQANSITSVADVDAEVQTHNLSPLKTDISKSFSKDVLPEAYPEHHRVSHRIDQTDVFIHDLEKRQANTSSSVTGVEAEVQTQDVALIPHPSDPLVNTVPQLADFNENSSSPHCRDVNGDDDQEIKRNSKKLISEGGDKSDEKVKGQESQVSPVASGCAMEIPSPYPFVGYPNYVYAQPIIDPSWRGCFDICNEKIGRLVAHLSNKACLKVVEAAKLMPVVLCVKMMPRLEAWPNSFNLSSPTDENIALYFFPGSESVVKACERLLNRIIDQDLVLMVLLENVELLIFSSDQLPQPYQLFNGKYYLWGVYRGRKYTSTPQSGDSHIVRTRTNECRGSLSELGNYTKADGFESFRMNPSSLNTSGSYNRDSPRAPLPLANDNFSLERGLTRL